MVYPQTLINFLFRKENLNGSKYPDRIDFIFGGISHLGGGRPLEPRGFERGEAPSELHGKNTENNSVTLLITSNSED
jgi:hypothetical protein